ncbi:uncharacterized, partial [Tachysurus ichikawai]
KRQMIDKSPAFHLRNIMKNSDWTAVSLHSSY